jgi:hypothetical protein
MIPTPDASPVSISARSVAPTRSSRSDDVPTLWVRQSARVVRK